MIGWFSINFRYSQHSCFGGRVNVGFVCFVAEVLPDHRGQNTVKGPLTQTFKEEWRQTLRGFIGGEVTERGRKRIPLLRQARLANERHLQGWDNVWCWTGLNITSFWLPHPGTSTERRQTVQDSHVGLATGIAERLSFVEEACPGPHAWSSIGLTLVSSLDQGYSRSPCTIRFTGSTTTTWTRSNKLA